MKAGRLLSVFLRNLYNIKSMHHNSVLATCLALPKYADELTPMSLWDEAHYS